jgi:arsenite methyltransferase
MIGDRKLRLQGETNMSRTKRQTLDLDMQTLRMAIQKEYETVAAEPDKGFHFHTGRPLARLLDYKEEWLANIPETAVESFAGTGNPFRLGQLKPGENVVDVGCGAGIDSLIAAQMVAPNGQVIGLDMTPAMLNKARQATAEAGLDNVQFRLGYGEDLPVSDEWADVVISNGVLNLMPDKSAGLQEMARTLKPNGRLQIGDIMVQKEVPESAKNTIDLWTG